MKKEKYRAEFYNKNGDINRKKECIKIIKMVLPEGIIIGSSMRGGVMYAAVKINTEVNAIVIVTSINKKELMNFSYRLYFEWECPDYYMCYDSILNLLSETDDANALKWRGKCRELNSLSRRIINLQNLPIGSKIEVNWNNEQRILTKTIVAPLRKPIWYDGYYRYNPISIEKNGYKIINH